MALDRYIDINKIENKGLLKLAYTEEFIYPLVKKTIK
jgi:hypothetical protein